MIKTCKACKQNKPLTDFYSHKKSKGGYLARCKTCISLQRKETYCPIKTREHNLKSKYKIDFVTYESMLVDQNYKCAICKTMDPGEYHGKFCVDHDHKTGKVRGLLCHNCNSALGNFYDNINYLQNAILYLQQ